MAGDRSPAVGDIVKDIQNDIKALVQNEIALAKAEVIPAAKSGGIGAGLLTGSAYFALCAAALLFIAGSLAIWRWLDIPIALGFVIMAGVLLVVAGLIGAVGLGLLKKLKGANPKRTIAQAKTSVDAVKGAIKQGNAAAKLPLIEGTATEQHAVAGADTPARRGR